MEVFHHRGSNILKLWDKLNNEEAVLFHLCLIWKESIQNCVSYRADTEYGMGGQRDGVTDGQCETYIPPKTWLCVCVWCVWCVCGGIITYFIDKRSNTFIFWNESKKKSVNSFPDFSLCHFLGLSQSGITGSNHKLKCFPHHEYLTE